MSLRLRAELLNINSSNDRQQSGIECISKKRASLSDKFALRQEDDE